MMCADHRAEKSARTGKINDSFRTIFRKNGEIREIETRGVCIHGCQKQECRLRWLTLVDGGRAWSFDETIL